MPSVEPVLSLRQFRSNWAELTQQRYTLLKFLNIIKQREYFFEHFFRSFNSIFEGFALKRPPMDCIRLSLQFLDEMRNFYQAQARRLESLQRGVTWVLVHSLLSARQPLLALLGTLNSSRPIPARIRTQSDLDQFSLSGASLPPRPGPGIAGVSRLAVAPAFGAETRAWSLLESPGLARGAGRVVSE